MELHTIELLDELESMIENGKKSLIGGRVSVEKNDLLTVEQYAQSSLGMVSEETLDSAYIEGNTEDGVEIYNNTDDTDGLFATVMNALGQNIISAWNSLQKSE